MSLITTFAPAAESARAVAAPMPRAAPVTNATRPSRSPMPSSCRTQCGAAAQACHVYLGHEQVFVGLAQLRFLHLAHCVARKLFHEHDALRRLKRRELLARGGNDRRFVAFANHHGD